MSLAEPSLASAEAKERADAFFDNDTLPDAPSEDLLRVMRNFVQEHAQELGRMREALCDSLSEAWAPENEIIGLSTEPFDRAHIGKMISTHNQQFNKVALVFAHLSSEMFDLTQLAESKFYGPLTMFGHQLEEAEQPGAAGEAPRDDSDSPEVQMGRFLPFLQDMSNFVQRCHNLIKNCVHQLACLYHERQKLYLSTFKHVHLETVFEAMGQVCRVLITLDAIVADNKDLQHAWSSYKRMVKYVRADPARYGLQDTAKLRNFEALMFEHERRIFNSGMFDGLLTQDYGLAESNKSLVAGNRVLADEFGTVLRALLKRYTTGIGEAVETYSREQLVDLYGLYALFRKLFERSLKPDKKLFRDMWALQKMVPLVVLFGRAVWMIPEFLARYCPIPDSSLSPSPSSVPKARLEYLKAMDEDFERRTEELYLHLVMWMVRIESELVASENANLAAVLNARAKLILNGILLANQIRNQATVCIHLHLLLGVPFRERNVRGLAVCSEMLQAIQGTYQRCISMVAENLTHMLGQTSYTLKRIFTPLLKKLEKRTDKLDDTKLDVLAAIELALSLLDGVPTRARQATLAIALSVAQLKNMLKQEHSDEVRYQLWKLSLLSTWQRTVQKTCNCSFLYWVTSLVPAFFDDIYQSPDQVHRLQYLFYAFRDASTLLLSDTPASNKQKLLEAYRSEVLSHFNARLLDPLCRAVETDLRLHIHSVVLQQASLRTHQQIKDLSRFFTVQPVRFFDTVIDIKQRVVHYLDQTFYNLNTVALHDWRVYAEMRNLAQEKFGLTLTEVHLPGNAHYSEALDVLEIMRNIHIFVSRYNYNMNTQIFIERAFDQKHLSAINIDHIANSIRTHGTGIMNTTVNFTYQFLCRKFVIFSEFLFDDHIKSRLIKDIRYYRTEKEQLDNKYPFDRADKFNRDIRKLGVTEDGSTFLDQFRQVITEIGNAMGYVRMVRSGGLHHCSNAIKFVPDLDGISEFAPAVEEQKLSQETLAAARALDGVIDEMSKNFAEGTEYFQVLVNIFEKSFRGEDQKHLKNFYIIVPPLTLNFVEKLIAQKERLAKKGGRQEACFTDDGFALGLAYILKLLGQDPDFDSLHWFESVQQHIERKRQDIARFKSGKRASEEDQQMIQLTTKRLDSLQTEMELLYWTFTGSRIFFRDPQAEAKGPATGVEGKEGKEESQPEAKADDPSASASASPSEAASPSSAGDIPAAPPMAPPMDDAGVPPAPPFDAPPL